MFRSRWDGTSSTPSRAGPPTQSSVPCSSFWEVSISSRSGYLPSLSSQTTTLDTWIITNERIINIEQEGLFNRTASELDLAAVQDTTAEIRGILQTLFTYGQVYVQTAGEKGRFHFKNIDNPEHVKELITRLVEDDKRRIAMLGAGGRGKIKSAIK